jgi:hypothetical protein
MMRIATAALSGRIYLGRSSKDGTHFVGNKTDVTSDVLKAIIDKVGPGNIVTVEVDGKPAFEIEVRQVSNVEAA